MVVVKNFNPFSPIRRTGTVHHPKKKKEKKKKKKGQGQRFGSKYLISSLIFLIFFSWFYEKVQSIWL